MAGESNVRFYTPSGERVSHTPKAKFKDDPDLPKFVYDAEDERYRKITSGDVFDDTTQQVIPSHATPVRILSAERFWESLTNDDGEQIAFPSVTQLHNILANDGVVKWQVNNVIKYYEGIIEEMLPHMPKPEDEGLAIDDKETVADLRQGALAASSPKDAAERGTRFHNAMEMHRKDEDWGRALLDHEIEPCRKIIAGIDEEMFKRHGKNAVHHVEQTFVNAEQGVAGTSDDAVDSTVYDYKFSDKKVFGVRGGLLKANWCYPERALQLANYADGHKIENPTLCNIFANVHTGEVAFYDWPDPQRWVFASRLMNMFFYMYKLGRFPALGDNTAMIMHALEEWDVKS